jgi:hypothetical protein
MGSTHVGMGPMYPCSNFPTLHMAFIHQEVDDDFHPEKVHLCELRWNEESPQILVVSNQIWCTISVLSQSVCYIFSTPLQIELLHFV